MITGRNEHLEKLNEPQMSSLSEKSSFFAHCLFVFAFSVSLKGNKVLQSGSACLEHLTRNQSSTNLNFKYIWNLGRQINWETVRLFNIAQISLKLSKRCTFIWSRMSCRWKQTPKMVVFFFVDHFSFLTFISQYLRFKNLRTKRLTDLCVSHKC